MADARKTLELLLQGRDQTGSAFRAMRRGASSAMASVGRDVKALGASFLNLRTMIAGAGIGYGIKKLFDPAIEASASVAGLRILLADSNMGAEELYATLEQFAATTPLKLPQLTSLSAQLLNARVAAEDLLPTLRMLGDASLGDPEKLNRVALAYTKIATLRKASMEELRQMAEAGVPILDALEKQMVDTGIPLDKLISSGKIGFAEVDRALRSLTDEGGRLHGMMAVLATETKGLISTLQDNLSLLLKALADDSLPEVNRGLEEMITLLGNMREDSGGAAGTVSTLAAAMANLAVSMRWVQENIPGGASIISGGLKTALDVMKDIGYKSSGTSTEEMAAYEKGEKALAAMREKYEKKKRAEAKAAAAKAAKELADARASAREDSDRTKAVADLHKDTSKELDRRAKITDKLTEAEAELARREARAKDDAAYAAAEAEKRASRKTIQEHLDAVADYLDAADSAHQEVLAAQDELSMEAAQATLDRARREADAEADAAGIKIAALEASARDIAESARDAASDAEEAWDRLLNPDKYKGSDKEQAKLDKREARIERKLPGLRERFAEKDDQGIYRDRRGVAATKRSQAILEADDMRQKADLLKGQQADAETAAARAREALRTSQDKLSAVTSGLTNETAALKDKIAELIKALEPDKDNPLGGMTDSQLADIQAGAKAILDAANEGATALRNALIGEFVGGVPADVQDLPPAPPEDLAAAAADIAKPSGGEMVQRALRGEDVGPGQEIKLKWADPIAAALAGEDVGQTEDLATRLPAEPPRRGGATGYWGEPPVPGLPASDLRISDSPTPDSGLRTLDFPTVSPDLAPMRAPAESDAGGLSLILAELRRHTPLLKQVAQIEGGLQ